ncbi:MAG TPA: N-acetyl-gamma-glutamyl-phosphate reductase [Caulobacteraceae bacterium]|nr:N-acetyl-gamma-glutamyl-phosphate reductase [Caulobacteraceae bacterium]
MPPTVFIDGEAGTTGLQIHARLAGRGDLKVASIDSTRRKDVAARRERLNSADVVILCLPDDAAREAVALVENPAVRVIDASTAHRIAPGWVYGFPELRPGQRDAIRTATRVSNPGCYPTGFLGLVAPLLRERLLPADWPVTVNAVSGYSGGGRSMIAQFEDRAAPDYTTTAYRPYATGLKHKHIPEMQVHAGLAVRPLFAPAVGRYAKGMIVEVPLQLAALPGRPGVADLHAALARAYEGEGFVEVVSLEDARAIETLDPEALNGTNRLRLIVFGADDLGQARLVAVLDNLGKGASGAAVQNLNLMLGLDEGAGLR